MCCGADFGPKNGSVTAKVKVETKQSIPLLQARKNGDFLESVVESGMVVVCL